MLNYCSLTVQKINQTADTTDENLPDNFSFLVDDILSQKFKRNLSFCDPHTTEVKTSTPVNGGPRKKLITPSKVSDFNLEFKNIETHEDEDSFDRMCK